jgi:hypothetical protein
MKQLCFVILMLCLAACNPRRAETVAPIVSPSVSKTSVPTVPNTAPAQVTILTLVPTQSPQPTAKPSEVTTPVNDAFDGKTLRMAWVDLEKNLLQIIDLPGGKTVATLPFSMPKSEMHEVPEYTVLRWSPDGRYLAFIRHEGGTNKLNVYDTFTGAIQLVQWELDFVGDVTWSPDNAWLAYSVWRNETGKAWTWTAKPSIAQSYLIGSGCHPQWTEDSQWIIFSQGSQRSTCLDNETRSDRLWIAKADGSDKKSLILPNPDGLDTMSDLCDYRPATGEVLACWLNSAEGNQNESALILYTSNGQVKQTLFETEEGIGSLKARFSPEMNWVWVARSTMPDFASLNWMVNLKDGSIYELSEENASITPIGWTPNEKAVILLAVIPDEVGQFSIDIIEIRTGIRLFSQPLTGLSLKPEGTLSDYSAKMLKHSDYWAQWVSTTWVNKTEFP